MNCQEFERTIIDFGYEHLMEVREAAPAVAHAETCAQCAARLNREQRMTAGLQGLVVQEASINAPERVQSALRAAFNEQQAAVAAPLVSLSPARLSFASNRWIWGLAAAAMLLLFTVIAALWLRDQGEKFTKAPPDPPISQPPPDKPPVVVPPMKRDGRIHPPRSLTARQTGKYDRRRRTPVEKRADDAAKLFPLTFVAKSESAEFVQTVRVEISRSTLLSMGLPINVDRSKEWIKADLIIGEDGVARAMRIFN